MNAEKKRPLGLSETAVTMIKVIGALFLFLLICGIAVIFFVYRFEEPLAFGLGLFLGCILSAVKVAMLEKSLNKAVTMDKGKAQAFATFQAILRYGLTIAVLLGVVFFPKSIGLFGIVAGILVLQISSYITTFIKRKKSQ